MKKQFLACSLFAAAVLAGADRSDAPAAAAPPAVTTPVPVAPAEPEPRFHFETGAYNAMVSNGFGSWRGADAQIWYRGNKRFIPAAILETQVRPGISQQSAGFFSIANWHPNFYTIQGFGFAPSRQGAPVLFPKSRYEFKAFYKLPANRNLVAGAGFSQFHYGERLRGTVFNAGLVWYRGKTIAEGNFFVNRNQPGNLLSSAGAVSIQHGGEKKYWFGGGVSGGKEFYRASGVTLAEVNLKSYSVNVFYRRWLARHFGVVFNAAFQQRFGAFTRFSLDGRFFYDF